MESKQITYLLDKHSLENLLYIYIDNSRRIMVTDKMIKNNEIEFDYSNNLLIVKENNFMLSDMADYKARNVIIYTPFDDIQGMYFVNNEEDRLVIPNELKTFTNKYELMK